MLLDVNVNNKTWIIIYHILIIESYNNEQSPYTSLIWKTSTCSDLVAWLTADFAYR